MAKLQRKSAKVFAEQASAGIGGVSQFGSLAAGDPQYSKDVDVIQALDAYKNGWSDAVLGNKSPAIEDRNALDYLLSYQQAYIMQHGVPEWLSSETYYKNCYVVDSNGQLRYSLTDNNTGNNPVDDALGQVSWGFGGARGTGKSVGEVYFSQSNSATDNPGALPLWTGELISNANNIYPQFYAWVQSHTSLCVTQAQYDSRISQYGECPFYVITSTSIRLPKLVNYLKMASGNALTQSEAGLPNITASIKELVQGQGATVQTTGAFSWERQDVDSDGGENRYGGKLSLDASISSAVYGKSNTVTPANTTLFPWVYVYNQAIAASTAQAAEFQEALSSKADIDFSNVNTTGKNTVVSWAMPDYTAGVDISSYSSSDNQYTAPCDGIIYADCYVSSNGGVYVDNVRVTGGNASANTTASSTVLIAKNSTVYIAYPDTRYAGCHFYPLKGAN